MGLLEKRDSWINEVSLLKSLSLENLHVSLSISLGQEYGPVDIWLQVHPQLLHGWDHARVEGTRADETVEESLKFLNNKQIV